MMKSLLKWVVLSGMLSMVCIHAVIPHMHHSEMLKEQHEHSHDIAHSFWDQLGLVFQEGLDTNLEHFIRHDAVTQDPFTGQDVHSLHSITLFVVASHPIAGPLTHAKGSVPLIQQAILSAGRSLRAPPACVQPHTFFINSFNT